MPVVAVLDVDEPDASEALTWTSLLSKPSRSSSAAALWAAW